MAQRKSKNVNNREMEAALPKLTFLPMPPRQPLELPIQLGMFDRDSGANISRAMDYINPLDQSVVNKSSARIAIFGDGTITIYALIGVSFFMSIMFPTIFSLGISGLGEHTKTGSSLIVMSIVGGAILPLGLGLISDVTQSIHYGYLVPLLCFFVVFLFARNVKPAI